jgi:isopentenyldiphosphate isomerase
MKKVVRLILLPCLLLDPRIALAFEAFQNPIPQYAKGFVTQEAFASQALLLAVLNIRAPIASVKDRVWLILSHPFRNGELKPLPGARYVSGGRPGIWPSEMEAVALADPETRRPLRSWESRSAVHERGLWHQAVHVFLEYEGNFILTRRSDALKTSPGKVQMSVVGHVDAGDLIGIANLRDPSWVKVVARREGLEEVGIALDTTRMEYVSDVNEVQRDDEKNKEFSTVLKYVLTRDEFLELQERFNTNEVKDLVIVPKQKLPRLLEDYPDHFTQGFQHVAAKHKTFLKAMIQDVERADEFSWAEFINLRDRPFQLLTFWTLLEGLGVGFFIHHFMNWSGGLAWSGILIGMISIPLLKTRGFFQHNSREGKWEFVPVELLEDRRPLPYMIDSLISLSSLFAFWPASQGLSQEITVLTAALLPVSLMLMRLIRVWRFYPTRRYGVTQLTKSDVDPQDLERFKEIDGMEIQEQANGQRWHLLKVWYFPQEHVWEVELRPTEGWLARHWSHLLAFFNFPGTTSGRIRFQYRQRLTEAELHFLSDSFIAKKYQGHGLYPEARKRILDRLSENRPTVIWHSLDELESLKDLYNALPAVHKVTGHDRAESLITHGIAHGHSPAEILVSVRRPVWKAFSKGGPVVDPQVIENLRIVKGLRTPLTQQINVLAEGRGDLVIQVISGKGRILHSAPWREEPPWLQSHWEIIERERSSHFFPNPSQERRMRRWEVRFAWQYEERFGRPPQIHLLNEIRHNVRTREWDLAVVDLFLTEHPAFQSRGMSEKGIRTSLQEFMNRFDYFRALNEELIDPNVSGLPKLEEVWRTQVYHDREFLLSPEQTHWAAGIMRYHDIALQDILDFLLGFRVEVLLIHFQDFLDNKSLKDEELTLQKKLIEPANYPQIQVRKKRLAGSEQARYDAVKGGKNRLERRDQARREKINQAWALAVDKFVARHPEKAKEARWFLKARLVGLLTEDPYSQVHKTMGLLLRRLHDSLNDPNPDKLLDIKAEYTATLVEIFTGPNRKRERTTPRYGEARTADRTFLLTTLENVFFPWGNSTVHSGGAMALFALHYMGFSAEGIGLLAAGLGLLAVSLIGRFLQHLFPDSLSKARLKALAIAA